MNNWIPKNKFVRFAAIAAILSFILYPLFLFIIIQKTNEIENSYRNTESASSKEERARALKSIAEANKELIQTLQDFLIQKGDEVKFIEQIEKIGRKSSVQFEISSINTKASQTNPFKEDIAIKMNTEGPWTNIMNFIDILEKMPFGVSIGNVNLDAKAPDVWSGSVEFIVFREK
jgi:hypothetical protein